MSHEQIPQNQTYNVVISPFDFTTGEYEGAYLVFGANGEQYSQNTATDNPYYYFYHKSNASDIYPIPPDVYAHIDDYTFTFDAAARTVTYPLTSRHEELTHELNHNPAENLPIWRAVLDGTLEASGDVLNRPVATAAWNWVISAVSLAVIRKFSAEATHAVFNPRAVEIIAEWIVETWLPAPGGTFWNPAQMPQSVVDAYATLAPVTRRVGTIFPEGSTPWAKMESDVGALISAIEYESAPDISAAEIGTIGTDNQTTTKRAFLERFVIPAFQPITYAEDGSISLISTDESESHRPDVIARIRAEFPVETPADGGGSDSGTEGGESAAE